jgi:dihydrofolate synthase/folylpolyglutamate synthase
MRRLRNGQRRQKPVPTDPAVPIATRADVLAWLDGRVDFERGPQPGGGTSVFGLTRVRRLLAALDMPHLRYPAVHVAGTKGKGSTVAMIADILAESGHRVGRYMSPHVHTVEERICVNGRPISAADLVAVFRIVIPAVDALDRATARQGGRRPTWFEVVTAAAFVHFARAGVDIAVLETGLGGRLDATNVANTILSVITSISLDHMAILGPTIGRIAKEKAGIIKPGTPVISGAMHPAARRVIAATARRRRASLLQLGRDFQAAAIQADGDDLLAGGQVEVTMTASRDAPRRYRHAMPGRHQADNAAVAVMAARRLDALGHRVPETAIVRGLAAARLPARIERLSSSPLVVIDAAHNVASMESLLDTLAPVLTARRSRVLVFAASNDKQIEEMLARATGLFDHVVLTRYSTNRRGATLERLLAAAKAAGLPKPLTTATPAEALRRARSLAGRRGVVCIAGSFFLATELRRGG